MSLKPKSLVEAVSNAQPCHFPCSTSRMLQFKHLLFQKKPLIFFKSRSWEFFLFPEEVETPVEEHIILSATNYGTTLDVSAVKSKR